MEIVNIVILSISGLLLTTVGALRMINPIKNYAKNSGIEIDNEVSLLNEVCGVGSLMMFSGITILLGIVLPSLTLASFLVATLVFIGFAFGRLLSIRMDGKPNKMIIQGWVSELVLGSANVFCLYNMVF
ncbi:MAG: DUF4345 domain-containing protein [Flavobacteriales bacterium]|jgi:hypothetical protein|nr:DUF4345 domain-containing protein [Flavobacteriales bacterium]NCG28833.1 DUF4345 domain-containing protein [Bacteroidota bacterium]MBT3964761.1 DUF4345 domain-containing protein [Flavobacteriales bacterium]MBT4704336.1 DUF4345 domain-containing protein [Flavobacteriales bacterium]MBT4930508.1 DUF4345 domain-containing protein [Flavobacteriales bacterium]